MISKRHEIEKNVTKFDAGEKATLVKYVELDKVIVEWLCQVCTGSSNVSATTLRENASGVALLLGINHF